MNGSSDGFFHQLKRRKVFQTAALYVVAAWVLLQVADVAFPGLRIPEEAIRYVWIAALIGFPLALLFAWRYQVTRQGIVRSAPLASGEVENLPLRKRDHLIPARASLRMALPGHAAGNRAVGAAGVG
jgi:hypothetical protein